MPVPGASARRTGPSENPVTDGRAAARTERADEQDAREKAADVRPPSHAPRLRVPGGAREIRRAHPELHQEPEEKIEGGRHLDERKKEDERHQRDDAGARVEDEVAAEDPGDRAGGSDVRDRRRGIQHRLERRGGEPGGQVEEEVAEVPQRVLHVVAEDPEVEEVPGEVQEAAVKEHRGEHRGEARQGRHPPRRRVEDAARNEGPPLEERLKVRPLRQLQKERHHVQTDQEIVREGIRPPRDAVAQRDHALTSSFGSGRPADPSRP